MKKINKSKSKFEFEKFELAKLQNPKIIVGGTGANDPDTGTLTSRLCSEVPTCKDKPYTDDAPSKPTGYN